jgi:hypothetical protein
MADGVGDQFTGEEEGVANRRDRGVTEHISHRATSDAIGEQLT